MIDLRLKKLDIYILKKFLGTFFFSLLIIIVVAVIFDFSEKIDDFMEKNAPASKIIVDYYLNFIPYFATLFSSLFTFIAVIFFTSKMAYRTEIIAILSSGVSFRRMMYPYFVGALIIATFTLVLNNFVIPHANKTRLEFEESYFRNRPVNFDERNIHRQISPGLFMYMESYSNMSSVGHRFTLEEFDNEKLKSKIIADYMTWDSTLNKWKVFNYVKRDINGDKETITTGERLDTSLVIVPSDFLRRDNAVESMDYFELNEFIDQQKLQGVESINAILIEKYKRLAMPFSTFILTLIGVALSCRKVRGGIGMHIGAGVGLCFSYILFMQFSSQFSIRGSLDPMLAVWIPNLLYAAISIFLYRNAPK